MVVLGLFLLVLCCTALLRWNKIRYRKKDLPPGTMGWPVFGETTESLRQGPKRARCGSFFKTHFLGSPAIISMDPDPNRYILSNESKGLFPGYPQSMLDILGKYNMGAICGSTHKYMRGTMLSLISPTMIKQHPLPKIDEFMRAHFKTWENKIMDIQAKSKELVFFSSLKQLAGIESHPIAHKLLPEFTKLVQGTFSLPINLPGTHYWRGLQATMFRQLLKERRASGGSKRDTLDGLLRTCDTRYKLTDKEIIDQIIAFLYSGFETISTTFMMALKFLQDHPKALEELRNEHLEIRGRKWPEDPIELDDIKLMRFTRAAIIETTRLATVVNGVLRRTIEDIELNGFVIPKGWRIYVYIREINYDLILYPDPLTSNPWRWIDKSLESHNHFLIFGARTRLCLAKELGITEISAFLHYFVTRYRWEEVGGEKLMKFPRVKAPKGLHIKV